ELKHGTISLITEGTPVIALVTDGAVSDKTVSNVKEVAARGGEVIVIAADDISLPEEVAENAFVIPGGIYAPFYAATALQMLAYHAAVIRGCDVDRPRNLAKSVTVE
ncbi:MAG: SIS domain-containing protein, partial [Clostridia bacterium]|nr:SIS domain-containing protein [Clostridia bacterium]